MRAVEDHRRHLSHHRQRAEIHHQVVIAETGPALGQEHPLIACRVHLFDGMRHVPRRHKLALLYVHRPARFARGHQQVGLAAKERGNLQHVNSFGRNLAMPRLMHIGQHWQAGSFCQATQNAHPFLESRPAEALHAGAISFVVAGLENVGNAQVGRDALDGIRHGADVGFGFNDAGAGDQKKLARAHMHRANFKGVAHRVDCNGWAQPDAY